MAKDLQARVVINADDRTGAAFNSVASKLRTLTNSSRQVKSVVTQVQAVQSAMAKAQKVNGQLGMVKVFRDAGKEALAMGRQHREALAQLRAVSREMKQIGPPTRALAAQYEAVKNQVSATGRALAEQKSAVRLARESLQSAGVNVDRLASSQRRLEQATKAATRAQRAQVNPWGAVPLSKSGVPLIPPPPKAMPQPPRDNRPAGAPLPVPVKPIAERLPVGEAVTGIGAIEAAKRALLAGADVDSERSQARQAGWKEDEIGRAEKAANRFAAEHGMSPGAALNMIREARPTFGGDLDTTLQNVGPFFSVATAMRQKSPHAGTEVVNKSVNDMVKAGEILGYSSDPQQLVRYADFMTRMAQVFGSQLRGEEVLNLAKRSKTAGSDVSFEFLQDALPTLLPELGGDATGVALMTLRQALVGGKMKKRAAENLEQLGLIDKKDMVSTLDQDVVGVRPNAVKGAETVRRNPLQWAEKYLIPAMDQKGVAPEDRSAIISTLFSDRNAEHMINLLVTQSARMRKDRGLVDQALGIEGVKTALRDDPYLVAQKFAGGAANLGAALADPLIGPLKEAAIAAAGALTGVAEAARGDRPAAAAGVVGGGLLGALGGWLSTQGSSLWWRGAAVGAGAGAGALMGGAAVPLAIGAGRRIGGVASNIGAVAGGRYYTPADGAGVADLEARAAAITRQMDQINTRIHPSRRGEFNADLDRLGRERQEIDNRIRSAKERAEALPVPRFRIDNNIGERREGNLASNSLFSGQPLARQALDPGLTRTAPARSDIFAPSSSQPPLQLPNLVEAMKGANIEAKLEGKANVDVGINLRLDSALLRAEIQREVRNSGHVNASVTAAGSTGKTMTEAGGD